MATPRKATGARKAPAAKKAPARQAAAPTQPTATEPRRDWTPVLVGIAAFVAVLVAWAVLNRDEGKTVVFPAPADSSEVIIGQPAPVAGSQTNNSPAPANNGSTVDGSSGSTPCPPTREVSMMIAGTEGALVREGGGEFGTDACLFEYRSSLDNDKTVVCVDGWACELDIAGPTQGKYYFGGGQQHQIDAGSFRLVAAYPTGDPIHTPCAALENSRNFLAFQGITDWTINPGNFNCDGATSTDPQVSSPAAAPAAECPVDSSAASALLGGNASLWSSLQDGWKYNRDKVGTDPVALRHPGFGRIDYDGGSTSSGSTPAGTEFTFWCNA